MDIILRPVSYALQNVVKLINTQWCHKKCFSLKAMHSKCQLCGAHGKKFTAGNNFSPSGAKYFPASRAYAYVQRGQAEKISRPEKNYHDTGTRQPTAADEIT